MDEHRNYWTPYLEITRGCPRSCTFCTAIRVSGQKMRLRPVGEVVEEIERRKLRRFFLTDDNFGLNFRLFPEYMEELLRALAKLPLDGWTAQAEQMVAEHPGPAGPGPRGAPGQVLHRLRVDQPGQPQGTGRQGTRATWSSRKQVIETVQKHGIGVVGLFVYGFDSDTPDIFPTAWECIKNSGLDSVSATILTPYPGTVQRKDLLGAGPHPPARHLGEVQHQPRHVRASADDRRATARRVRLALPAAVQPERRLRCEGCGPGSGTGRTGRGSACSPASAPMWAIAGKRRTGWIEYCQRSTQVFDNLESGLTRR